MLKEGKNFGLLETSGQFTEDPHKIIEVAKEVTNPRTMLPGDVGIKREAFYIPERMERLGEMSEQFNARLKASFNIDRPVYNPEWIFNIPLFPAALPRGTL